MVNISRLYSSGASGNTQSGSDAGSRGKPRQQPFAVQGEAPFRPEFYPSRIQITKERALDRSDNFCEGEDVTDDGAKNWDIHVNGPMLKQGLDEAKILADSGAVHTLVSATWSGDVHVKSVEIEGPTGWYPPANSMIWEYRMDFVADGEVSPAVQDGIVSRGKGASEDEIDPLYRQYEPYGN